MRLLHTNEFRIQEFVPTDVPKYAILSHVWGKEEVTLRDIESGTFAQKDGFLKLKASCQMAAEDQCEWIWVDTCCIDKSSSAELSEAINSMYRWYQEAALCYAYLADVENLDKLGESRWFTRGWTLQELIAPRQLVLLDMQWGVLGSKKTLVNELSRITGIPQRVLRGISPFHFNVAERMSWAATRQTTREEDIAYSLMGLFGVHMSPIYGEGAERAFIRLQEEILKRSSDQTLFLWTRSHDRYNQGLLATTPSAFCIHYDCFRWLMEPMDVPRDECSPYSLLSSISMRESFLDNGLHGRNQRDAFVGAEYQPSSFGSQGLEISLLATKSSEQSPHIMVGLDVWARYPPHSNRVYIVLIRDITFGSTPRFVPDRLGSLRREVCIDKESIPFVGCDQGPFYRQRLTISQISDPGCSQSVRFKYIDKGHAFSTSEVLIFESGHFEKAIFPMTGSFMGEGGCIMLKHRCLKCDEANAGLLIFGTRGRNPEPWCIYVGLLSSAQGPDDQALREYGYSYYELLKGRLAEHYILKAACGLRARIEIELDEEENTYRIRIHDKDERH